MDEEAFQRYQQDPEGFLEARNLSDQERVALARVDYPTLYARGSHPLLLMVFASRTWPGDRRALMEGYGKAVEPFGYPDYFHPVRARCRRANEGGRG